MLMCRFVICLAILGYAHSAEAHGIAGNRFFPGTLTFDDPAVADEAIVPNFASSKHLGEGGDVVDNRFSWSFFRLLTKTLGVGIDSGWIHRNWGVSQRSGFDTTNLTIKGEVYRNDLHETLVAAGLGWGIGHSGAQGVGSNAPDLITPGIFFGKGFGDLPDSLAWLRPFGITGAVTLEHPMTGSSINFGIDEQTGQLTPMVTRKVDTLSMSPSGRLISSNMRAYCSERFAPDSFACFHNASLRESTATCEAPIADSFKTLKVNNGILPAQQTGAMKFANSCRLIKRDAVLDDTWHPLDGGPAPEYVPERWDGPHRT